jgi:hypothetical protein
MNNLSFYRCFEVKSKVTFCAGKVGSGCPEGGAGGAGYREAEQELLIPEFISGLAGVLN